MQRLTGIVIGALLATALSFDGTAAHAHDESATSTRSSAALQGSPAARGDYKLEAERVARVGDCKNIRNRSRGGKYAYSALVCDLRGHRINILTYSSLKQEAAWLGLVCTFYPKQWVAVARGVVMTAKDGNRAATKAARKVYGILSVRCDLWLDSRTGTSKAPRTTG